MAAPDYLRFPHVHAYLLAFVAEDDVWLAPAEGGRAWRLTSDGGQASHPRFSPDGSLIAWTSWRDGSPEVYTADADVASVDLSRARFQTDPAALWRHAYAEFGRLLRRDFWTPDMSDVDWDAVLEEYRFLLDRVRTSAEFGDLLDEVGAELGTSHVYVRPSWAFTAGGMWRGAPAALLGADVARSADGRWIVERVLPGESSDPHARSPFAAPGVAVRACVPPVTRRTRRAARWSRWRTSGPALTATS